MNHAIKFLASAGKRACALLLCTAMLLGILPTLQPEAQAASSTQQLSLDKLVSWNIMRGDQYGNLEPNRAITRAEFASMLNRTFGYTKTGAQPFRDVVTSDWYYDDISIAYTAGYFQGTSKTTASPNSTLTREEAATLLCRNLMLQPQSGEDLSFTDSRLASSWSRGYIKAAAEEGILLGDPEGTFRPLDNITRGEVAIMLVRVIGTPIQSPGTYSNSVAGNLMVSCSGVTLENMTVTGDLYITGGVGLGYVTLNNVKVYGKIIASGAGESNKGDCSIILKNSYAPEMIVDSPSNQYVTIRSVGSTEIGKVYVRTDTYLEGKSSGDYGFQFIQVDGEEGTQLDLAGNIHEVITLTPKSKINVGSGTVEKMTIDEQAVGSTVRIDQGAVVEELNLDTATTVSGKGDIGTANINAPGCVIEMLPDIINIRPGITANVDGTIMDNTLAQQMSDKPRILSGYPRMDDIAPNQATASFMTNKPGKLYWAVRLSGDGAFTASDLIEPPSYGGKIVKSGNLSVKDANTKLSQKISGLQIDTSYVLSAVLVDSRGDYSVVKSVYFTTPDNSKPAFASGYPKASTIEDTYVDFDVATTKTCTLYWAIYKKGMPAPTANDFKDGSLSGAIDSGTLKMIRSEEDNIRMGSEIETAKEALEEMTEYDAYFFLTDSINDSSVTKVSVKTADRTPPKFLTNYPRISKIQAKSLTGEGAINEDGKVYWAAVKHGTEYPVPNTGLTDDEARELDKKLQIKGGMYALANGSFSAKENTAQSFNMNNLEAETAYDIYFVAEDTSGNLSTIEVIKNAKTLDNTAPELIELRFSQANDENIPLADTDITLVFSEDIYSAETRMSLVEMYESDETEFAVSGSSTGEKTSLRDIIDGMFTLNNLDSTDPIKKWTIDLGDDVLDKTKVKIELNDEGQTEVTFTRDALNLLSGTNYQFVLNFISDSSSNTMGRDTKSEVFRTLDAQVDFTKLTEVSIDPDNGPLIDASFSMVPYAGSTESASKDTRYDVLIASDTTITFELYSRERGETDWNKVPNGANPDNPDEPLSISHDPNNEDWTAISLNNSQGLTFNQFPKLWEMPTEGYEYAIVLRSVNQESNPEKWDATINIKAFCVAGAAGELNNLVGGYITSSRWESEVVQQRKVSSIGSPADFNIEIRRVNQTPPQFVDTYPQAEPGDSVTKIKFQLDRSGKLFYVVAPKTQLAPTKNGQPIEEAKIYNIGDPSRHEFLPSEDLGITYPSQSSIVNQYFPGEDFRSGIISYEYGTGQASFSIENLKPNTPYYIYFVLQGSYKDPSYVHCYQFTTGDVVSPVLTARGEGNGDASYTIAPAKGETRVEADTAWMLYPYVNELYPEEFQQIIDEKVTEDPEELEALWNLLINPQDGSTSMIQAGKEPVEATTSGKRVSNFINTDLLEMNNTYVLFVGAKNVLGGRPVFKAVTNIRLINMQGPQIVRISTGNNKSSNPEKYFSGTVGILFSPALRVQAVEGIQLYPFSARKDSLDKISSDGTITFDSVSESQITVSLGAFADGETFNIIPRTVRSAGETIAVKNLFYSPDGFARDSILSFRMKKTVADDGNVSWNCVINGGSFDGQTSETNPTP
ncbi:S-layer homology domain-containing protein [Intestinibacillus sp. Marseille-P6563]|uniref:S-layer homology domain-containing protein n=1 Tax=Intestinibacillus sp. Marseille-P6563 TaxID=2364792 RepID=UPI000F06B5D9|nr:S-layer homology domain-containing protein [Intestinibacillus sp. Marseille-P6563]